MKGFVLGKKGDQSQRFGEAGERVPTTFITTTPCYMVGISAPQDGPQQMKVAFGEGKNVKKPVIGELKKAGIETPLRHVRQVRLEALADWKVVEEDGKMTLTKDETKITQGSQIKPEMFFKVGDIVDVAGDSRGKGFQGVVKRHNFRGGPKTHGQSDRHRAPGSIGQTTTPGRVYKGKRMAGRMGGDRITVKGLKVLEITENGITVSGLVPGRRTGLLEVTNRTK